MGVGPGRAAEQASIQNAQAQQQIAQQQMALEGRYADIAQGELARRTTLEQPLVDFNKALLSGDRTAALSAVAPMLGNVATQTKQAGANIMNTVPAGAGRDYALAQNQLGQGQQVAGILNNAFTGALTGQAQLGAEALGAGLQEEGAALSAAAGATSSYGAANQAYGQIQETEARKKAARMSFLGELAGAGGMIGAAKVSDIRLKEDIQKIGEVGDVNLYYFRFKGDGSSHIGAMAQELYTTHPEAVVVGGQDPNKDPWMVKYDELITQLASGDEE